MLNKKFILGLIFLSAIFIGGYFVYKIPQPASQSLSQSGQNSGNITVEESGSTLGIETSQTPIASGSSKIMEENKLVTEDLVVGTGEVAVASKKVTVNYVGTLTNGKKFDSSYDRNEPFSFVLGTGEVIAGWDQGVSGMKVGGKRKLTIPPALGYGSNDLGVIPPNSTLLFEVELLKVE